MYGTQAVCKARKLYGCAMCVLQTSPVLACRAYTDGIQAVRGSVGELPPRSFPDF